MLKYGVMITTMKIGKYNVTYNVLKILSNVKFPHKIYWLKVKILTNMSLSIDTTVFQYIHVWPR